MFRRLLVAAALLVGSVAVFPTQAATPTTVTGLAGSYLDVTLTAPFRYSFGAGTVGPAKVDRGDFVGLALVSTTGDSWVVLAQGLTSRTPCLFGNPCDRTDLPIVAGAGPYDNQGTATLPAGTYHLALLGRPGAKVQVSAQLPGLRGTLATTRRGALTVKDLASTYPTAGDQEPKRDGSVAFRNTTRAVTGMVWRQDTRTAKSASLDYCLASGAASALPQPLKGACEGETVTTGGMQVSYIGCPQEQPPGPIKVCLPANADSDLFSWGLASVQGPYARMSFDTEVRAVKSRGTLTAFALTF